MPSKKETNPSHRVMGIDPGYERLGIAIVERDPNGKDEVIHSECFKTKASRPHKERLREIGERISEIIEKYDPDTLAIEKLFFNTNQKTALLVAEARGVILYEAAAHSLSTEEFNPSQIKISVTGHGRADKEQIKKMLYLLLKFRGKNSYDDEYDAIAVALTCLSYIRN